MGNQKAMEKEQTFSIALCIGYAFADIVVVLLADSPYIAGLFGEQAGK